MAEEPTDQVSSVDNVAEWLITLFALGMMVAAFVAALSWPANAAMFPLALSGFAIALLLFKIVGMIGAKVILPPDSGKSSETEDVLEAQAESVLDSPAPGVFATAGPKAWLEALSCIAIFIVLLTLFGMIASLVVFGIGYLKLVGKRSFLFAALYVGALLGVVYVLFVELLSLPLPKGLFFP